MADMANIEQVEDAWEQLREIGVSGKQSRADDLYEFDRRDQGVLRTQRRSRLHIVKRRSAV